MSAAGPLRSPAVLLATADSIFTATLAQDWLNRGLDVKVVTLGERGHWLPHEVEVIDARQQASLMTKALGYCGGWLAHRLQQQFIRLGRHRFQKVTGKSAPDDWEWNILPPWLHARTLAAVALSLKPKFVFGQEAFMYGRATALCHGTPRILFPWGSDIYNAPESWFGADWLVRSGLRGVDLIVPSAHCAGAHLIERFGVDPAKVQPVSWGVDLQLLTPITAEQRVAVRRHWNIPLDASVVFNARRFRPQWGSETVLRACLQAAAQHRSSHYVIVAGPGASDTVMAARQLIDSRGLTARFTVIDEQISLESYTSLAAIADVFVSLTFRGDMRSSSVLQCAAAGAVPVIGDSPEYRYLTTLGFSAELVPGGDSGAVSDAVTRLLRDASRRAVMTEQNRIYLKTYENRAERFAELFAAVNRVCERYSGSN